jgi:hypothetical protein
MTTVIATEIKAWNGSVKSIPFAIVSVSPVTTRTFDEIVKVAELTFVAVKGTLRQVFGAIQ